jgi:predicted enzyme related to lactoylglutathione lyase
MNLDGPLELKEAFVTLASARLMLLVEFYQQFFGQAPNPLLPQQYAEFQLPGLRLALFAPQSGDRSEFTQPSRSAVSLCLEVTSLEAAIARLAAIGYPPPGSIITASHGREIYAYDPDGNRIILHQAQ